MGLVTRFGMCDGLWCYSGLIPQLLKPLGMARRPLLVSRIRVRQSIQGVIERTRVISEVGPQVIRDRTPESLWSWQRWSETLNVLPQSPPITRYYWKLGAGGSERKFAMC
jgi:hypothetical protein